jgi:hypothetical protein
MNSTGDKRFFSSVDPNSAKACRQRAHGLQVKVGRKLAEGRSLWQPNMYDCVLLDVHSQLPEEAIDFCEQLRRAAPEQRIAFLSDPPHMCPSNGHTKSQLKTNTKEQRVAELKTAA